MKTRRICYSMILIALGFALPFGPAAAASALKEIVIVSSQYPPHIYEENGMIKGLRVGLLTELFQRMGYRYTPKLAPWSRAVIMTKEGRAGGICSIWYKPERESYLTYPRLPYVLEVQAIYRRSGDRELAFSQEADFKGLRVGVIRGFAFPKEFLESPSSGLKPYRRINRISSNWP